MFDFLKKKKKFTAVCELSNTPLEKESTYILSSAQIISSKKFWDNKMTEPETLPYTESFFKNGDETAANIRNLIFNKYASHDKAWIISDACINMFDEVDLTMAKEIADDWWETKGENIPIESTTSLASLAKSEYDAYRAYALNEAGKSSVSF